MNILAAIQTAKILSVCFAGAMTVLAIFTLVPPDYISLGLSILLLLGAVRMCYINERDRLESKNG